MKIFLSAIEGGSSCRDDGQYMFIDYILKERPNIKMKWNLVSYYYIRKAPKTFKKIIDNSEQILIDSGAHTFQFGTHVDWEQYTKEYAEFIKQNDCDKILGYFEMDVENIIGMKKVLELRKILEEVTDKIIPVWHPDRGIEDYEKMCKQYSGKIIAIGGFRGTDIKDEQFIMFMKTAKKYNCKVHCLGMTRRSVLDKVPFDFVDSSSWVQQSIYGRIGNMGKVSRDYSKNHRLKVVLYNYLDAMKMQTHYYQKWKKECKD